MESKKSEPINQTTEPNQSETNQPKRTKVNRQATNSRQTRQIGIGMYCFSLISISPYLCAYLRACTSV